MTAEAESADVFEIALATAFRNGHNVVGIPEAFARAVLQPPKGEEGLTIDAPGEAKTTLRGDSVCPAQLADAVIPQQNLFAKVRRLGAKLPLMHAKA
jgi:hypothetical protein